MKIKTKYAIVLLLFSFSLTNCGNTRLDKNPSTVAEAEKLMAKKKKNKPDQPRRSKRKPTRFIGKHKQKKQRNQLN